MEILLKHSNLRLQGGNLYTPEQLLIGTRYFFSGFLVRRNYPQTEPTALGASRVRRVQYFLQSPSDITYG
jgi:hypothetical protein